MTIAAQCRRILGWPFWLLLGCVMASSGLAEATPASRPVAKNKAPTSKAKQALETPVERLLASQQFAKAAKLLQAQLKAKKTAKGLFFLARTQVARKKYLLAARTSMQLVKLFPKSSYATKATMMAADALVMGRKYAQAQALYAKQIAHLLSKKQRLAVAEVFLRFARRYAKKRDGKPARYRKSIHFYKKTLALELPEPQRRKVSLALAWLYHKHGYWWRAYSYLQKVAKKYKKSPDADVFHYLLAKHHMKRRRRYYARPILRDLLADFPKSKWLPETYLLLAQSYRLPGRTSSSHLALGIEVLQTMLKRFPTHPKSRTASFWIAKAYYHNSRYDKAIEHARKFIASYGDKKKAKKRKKAAKDSDEDEAQRRYVALARYRIGQCYLAQKRFDKAIAAFQAFLKAHPTDRDWPKAQRQIIAARYAKAQNDLKRKKWKQAKASFQQFLQRYPINSRNARLMWQLGQIELKQKHVKKAIEAWQRLVSKYPRHTYGRRARWDIARAYERKLKQYDKALAAYRKINYWRFRRMAKKAIRRLTKKSLAVQTTRVFTTHEKPIIVAKARNLKSLHVRMYRIDPETYFRKMQRFAGMDKLDIQLIRPDKSWDVAIKDFRKHHLHEIKIPLGTKGPGVAVYHVSGGKLAATTVALVSDLQILSKVNRRSMFVYALDSHKQKPKAGVRLLISDGKKILHVGKTNAQGVFQRRFKQLRSAGQIRILALANGSVAANDNSLSGVSYGRDISLAGVVFTERPVYQPGETVFIKGIIREVKDGRYQLPTKAYQISISGPDNRVIFRRKATPGAFGSFDLSFATDPSAPRGWYKIRASRKKGGTFLGRFRLAKYRLPKYLLSFSLKRRVFQRRHQIKGKLQVRFGFGAPAAGQAVRIQLGSLKRKGRTDAKGVFAFSFPTRELTADRSYKLRARLLGESASTSQTIWLRSTMFDLGLSTIRGVYAAGESFEVKLSAFDPAKKPHAADVTLTWLKVTRVYGRKVETKVGEKTIKIDKSGKASTTLQIKKGGHYLLRATSNDQFKQPITASRKVFVSGKDDKTPLRLLSDKDSAQVGDTLQVKLLARKEGVALITYEANEILHHRLIPALKKGETSLKIKVTTRMSPNFALRVALLHKQKLFTAEKHFLISKKLKLQVKLKEKDIRPGGWATLLIQARDQRGKGVKAEVSVAIVDQALYALFRDRTPTLASVFYAYRRNLSQSLRASHTYKHSTRGGKISDALLQLQTRPSGSSLGNLGLGMRQRRRRRGIGLLGTIGRGGGGRQIAQQRARFGTLNLNGLNRGLFGGQVANGPLRGSLNEQQKKMFEKGLRQRFATTAYWNPAVVTDAEGRASVRVRMPDNPSTWKIWLRGVAKPTLVGETTHTFKSKKPFMVALRLPGVLTEGDEIRPAALLHNHSSHPLNVKAILQIKGLGVVQSQQASLAVGQSRTVTFAAIPTRGAGGRIVQVKLGGVGSYTPKPKGKPKTLTDAVARNLTIRTPGVQVFGSRSGTTRGHVRVDLKLPGSGPFRRQKLTVSLGPVSAQWLIDLARRGVGARHFFPGTMVVRAAMTERVLRYLQAHGQGDTPAAKQLKRQLDGISRALWLKQRRDGGWTFLGGRRFSGQGRLFSAEIFSLLARAHLKHGLFAPTNGLKRARKYVKRGYHRTFSSRAKATILAALGLMPGQDHHELFSYANRLYRSRSQLDLESLSQLGFALIALNRKHLAKDLVPFIEKRLKAGERKPRAKGSVALPFAAQAALALELLATLAPGSARRKAGIAALLKQRRGFAWGSLRLTQRAVGALAAHYGKMSKGGIKLNVVIKVDAKVLKTVTLNASTSTVIWRHFFPKGAASHRIELVATGLGQYQYAIRLAGHTLKPDRSLRSRYYKIKRKYQPAYRQVNGRSFAPGYGVVRGAHKRWKRVVKALPVGDHARVSVVIKRRKKGRLEDLVVDEPIPGGVYVLPSSVSVSRGHFVMEPGRIRFFLHHSASRWTIRYHMYGARAGRFHIPATRVWSFAEPGRLSLGKAHKLTVLPAKTTRRPHYPMTPDELLALGTAHYKAGRKGVARGLLEKLVNGYKLKAYALRKAARMLLQIAFAQGPQEAIVRYFELRKEQDPDAIVSFDDIVKVAQAYAVQGEHERAAQIYQATLQAHFLDTLQVAGTLEKQGEFDAARTFIEGLLRRYPDMKPLKEAAYGLAQTAYQQGTKSKAKPKKFKAWMGHAERLLRQFVKLYPSDPSADTAAYTRANVLLELKRRSDAIRYLARLGKRYPKSNELDSIHYLHAYALYLKRESVAALKLLKLVSSQQYPDGKGGTEPSENRHLATYLIAQLHHANNKLATALTWYQKVRTRFADAAAQVRHFKKVQLKLSEVTTIGAKARAAVKVTHQNIKALTILAYRVDLMKLYLHKKNLNAVTKINLAGIRPTYRSNKTLGKGQEFRARTSSLTLPLKKRGAYLIVLKSAEREVSGILLRTRLRMEVQQGVQSGRVTAYLLRGHRPVPNALTRVIGSADNKMRSGKTDLRGIFTAQGLRGFATVIAQDGDDFAFFRGKLDLQHSKIKKRPKPRHRRRRWRRYKRKKYNKFYNFDSNSIQGQKAAPSMLDNIIRGNELNQSSGRKQMLDLYRKSRRGVQMKYLK